MVELIIADYRLVATASFSVEILERQGGRSEEVIFSF